mmetsp:Transcript_100924/g.291893  ORF Transcript_100924/g.291893 Transcript_100924/m.291893 type:complete len:348 (+) Transcript_100924:460-1503(+)
MAVSYDRRGVAANAGHLRHIVQGVREAGLGQPSAVHHGPIGERRRRVERVLLRLTHFRVRRRGAPGHERRSRRLQRPRVPGLAASEREAGARARHRGEADRPVVRELGQGRRSAAGKVAGAQETAAAQQRQRRRGFQPHDASEGSCHGACDGGRAASRRCGPSAGEEEARAAPEAAAAAAGGQGRGRRCRPPASRQHRQGEPRGRHIAAERRPGASGRQAPGPERRRPPPGVVAVAEEGAPENRRGGGAATLGGVRREEGRCGVREFQCESPGRGEFQLRARRALPGLRGVPHGRAASTDRSGLRLSLRAFGPWPRCCNGLLVPFVSEAVYRGAVAACRWTALCFES